jgi:hypothetical protein
MIRIAFAVAYLVAMVVALFMMDAEGGGSWGTVWLVASILLGAGTGDYRLALLSILTIPMAIPFGLPDDPEGDPVFPLWVATLAFAPISSVSILFGAFVRQTAQERLRRRRESPGGVS